MCRTDHAVVARQALHALAEQVDNAQDLPEAALVTGAFFGPDGGVADAFTSVLWAVARQFEAHIRVYDDADPAYAQWHRLAAIAETHDDLTDGLASTPNALRLLGPPRPRPRPQHLTTQREQALAATPTGTRPPTRSATGSSPPPAPSPCSARPTTTSTQTAPTTSRTR